MSVIKEFLVIEDILSQLFAFIPPFVNKRGEFPVTFKYGDEQELTEFLSNNSNFKGKVYPLIWLVYPYLENHTRTKVESEQLSLILAVQGSASSYSEERMEQTFKTVLFPLCDSIKTIFKQSYVIDTGDNYEVLKYPNYSVSFGGESEQEEIDRWDALKVSFSAKFNNNCIKPIIL